MARVKNKLDAQNPLLLRCNRLMEAFAKSDDERDFFLDRQEGFLIYVDLDKPREELTELEETLAEQPDRFILIPKMTFYETKKIMEGFVNEKVYDIDTKEKLLDIIQSREARDHFLEFIFDHHHELEKWQTYYQERSRVRIIEWLRVNHFQFAFEEDLELPKNIVEKIKQQLFESKVGKDIQSARKIIEAKSKTYYSTEALNPRPKRGRPPKQAVKPEIEPQFTVDIYTTVPAAMRPFLFTPDITGITAATFSSKFENEETLLAHRRAQTTETTLSLESINEKLASLRQLTSKWSDGQGGDSIPRKRMNREDEGEEGEDYAPIDDDEEEVFSLPAKKKGQQADRSPKVSYKATLPAKKPLPPAPKKGMNGINHTLKKESTLSKKGASIIPSKAILPSKKAVEKGKPSKIAPKTKVAPPSAKKPVAKAKAPIGGKKVPPAKSKFRPIKKLKPKAKSR